MKTYMQCPAQLFSQERELLKQLAEEIAARFGPHTRIVNIGVRQGGSLHCFRAGAPNAVLYGIDIDLSQPMQGDPRADLIEGDSNDPLVQAQVAPPVHLVFIDGGHDFDTVAGDIKGWLVKVPSGGIAAFHDFHNRSYPGVTAAINAWRAETGWEERWIARQVIRMTSVFERI